MDVPFVLAFPIPPLINPQKMIQHQLSPEELNAARAHSRTPSVDEAKAAVVIQPLRESRNFDGLQELFNRQWRFCGPCCRLTAATVMVIFVHDRLVVKFRSPAVSS